MFAFLRAEPTKWTPLPFKMLQLCVYWRRDDDDAGGDDNDNDDDDDDYFDDDDDDGGAGDFVGRGNVSCWW